MFSPIVNGNLNIRGNRRCDKISLLGLRKGHMIWNCSIFKGVWICFKPIRLSIFQWETCLQQLLQSHTYSPISIIYSFHNKIYTLIHFHMGISRFEIFSFLQIYFYLYYLLNVTSFSSFTVINDLLGIVFAITLPSLIEYKTSALLLTAS